MELEIFADRQLVALSLSSQTAHGAVRFRTDDVAQQFRLEKNHRFGILVDLGFVSARGLFPWGDQERTRKSVAPFWRELVPRCVFADLKYCTA